MERERERERRKAKHSTIDGAYLQGYVQSLR
jgi:hypothetical protein